jgi:drug/metabolite transporter (DMT)-like permease
MVRRDPALGIMNISADAGLIFGISGAIITGINWANGHSSLTAWNFFISFIVSLLQMICVLVGQNCSVKGLAGPTIAIIYSQSLFCTLLQALFLGLLPSVSQLFAAALAFSGIIMIIFLK